MLANIMFKYGVVPNKCFPESHITEANEKGKSYSETQHKRILYTNTELGTTWNSQKRKPCYKGCHDG